MDFHHLADKALAGTTLSRDECRSVLRCPDHHILELLSATYRVRHHYCGNRVHFHMLINAKSGICPEDCHYCSQSHISTAEIERYPMVSMQRLLEGARKAKEAQCRRYCIAISTRGANNSEIAFLTRAIRHIKENVDIGICCTVGLISEEKAQMLREAGVEQLNHNLNTSERYYSMICTTHTYQDRLNTLHAARRAGLQLCTGAIFGQGETEEDIIDVGLALRELAPQSIPINFLIPFEGTPFAHHRYLRPYDCLRILCLMRLLNPAQELRVSAGREVHLRSLQPLALYAANSVFVSGYLTSSGQGYQETRQMIADMGFELEETDEHANEQA
ncbi:biotin synthase [Thermosporothrix hazakensis]|jgi:biotin synthase|uniref:Biotin synthase n=2 Tax=Thermosporothrix TaxID=768650 RepID=A0A326TZP6_THEHA|nr:biotin synthase BioB [Thermosporothrix hazakensis]PZW22197.1 biotin synthase [Thermosporothrix hazakensis]BBH89884.1 biotin synthase [Thermosporothrix sp. COM3]GCE48080.1 biotin synthase [Thermosporothrix hazakensis]